jgi:putative addiction module component (TIGR02574 family)
MGQPRNARDVEEAALQLPEKARAELARVLLLSLDSFDEESNEAVWAQEAERRYAEIKAGLVETIPSEQVFQEARSRRK